MVSLETESFIKAINDPTSRRIKVQSQQASSYEYDAYFFFENVEE